MGDASDQADVDRFTRSPEGKRCMDKFRAGLVGKRIVGLDFTEYSFGLGITLLLEDGDYLDLHATTEAFSVEAMRDRYQRVLMREYYVDFPERKPSGVEPVEEPDIEDLQCPECGQDEAFSIQTCQSLTFYRDGTVTEGDEGQQWNPDSPCRCEGCQHEGVVGDFIAGGT